MTTLINWLFLKTLYHRVDTLSGIEILVNKFCSKAQCQILMILLGRVIHVNWLLAKTCSQIVVILFGIDTLI